MKPDILPAGLFVASKNNLQHEPAPHFGFDEFSFHAMVPACGRRENSQHETHEVGFMRFAKQMPAAL
jgi:hypothetical protein